MVPGLITGDEARQIMALAQGVGLKQSLVATTRKVATLIENTYNLQTW